MTKEDLCKHDLIPEWCAECKHKDKSTVRELVVKRNMELVENFEQWPTT